MADVKVGWSQTSKPAPLGYRKFENAYMVAFLPAITSFLAVIPVSALVTKIEAAALVCSVALIKGIGMVIGNGQIYSPSNQVVEDQKAGS